MAINIRKNFYFLVFLLIVFLSKPSISFASTIFNESLSGPIGSTWTPNDLIFVGSSPAVYNSQGAIGTSTSLQSYINTSITTPDTIIRWTMDLSNGNPFILIDCRMSLDDKYEQRIALNGDGTLSINAWPNGGTSPYIFNNSIGIHNFELDCIGNNITVKEDGSNLISSNPGWDGTTSTGEQNQEFRLMIGDTVTTLTHLEICDASGCSPSIPSPTPTPIQLPITVVKQAGPSAPWQNETYDLANIWSPHNPSIGTWGCALTSADMILKYYGIDYLPGFGKTPLTPETLDAWLNLQPDGYIPNGNVNWQAIARLSKDAPKNNSTLLDALEYQRVNFADTSTLLSDLEQNHPDILEEPGHFVVSTGQNTNKVFTIADPYYNRTLLSDYGNTFLSLGRFIPSFTDLSYLLFTSDPSLTVTLKDSTNTPVGTSYTQQPLQGAGTNLIAGNPINLLYLAQPGNGNYTLTVSANTNQIYTLKGFLYDKDGNVFPFSQTGVADSNNQNTININFDNQNINNDTTQKVITISTFLSDLNDLYKLNQVKTGAYESLKEIGKSVQHGMQKHNSLQVKMQLAVLNNLLGIDKKIGLITNTSYQILSSDIKYLQSH